MPEARDVPAGRPLDAAGQERQQFPRVVQGPGEGWTGIESRRRSMRSWAGVKTREFVYLHLKEVRAFFLPIFQGLNGHDMP